MIALLLSSTVLKLNNNLNPGWHSLSRYFHRLTESQDTQVLDSFPPDCNYESRAVNAKKNICQSLKLNLNNSTISINLEGAGELCGNYTSIYAISSWLHSQSTVATFSPLSLYHRWSTGNEKRAFSTWISKFASFWLCFEHADWTRPRKRLGTRSIFSLPQVVRSINV